MSEADASNSPTPLQKRTRLVQRSLRHWSSPKKKEPRLRVLWVVRPLEFLRGQIPQGGVPTDAVVGTFDVLEDARLGILAGGVVLVVDQRALQAGEAALHGCVVPALRHPPHATGDAVPAQATLVALAGVLAAAVRVGQQPLLGNPARRSRRRLFFGGPSRRAGGGVRPQRGRGDPGRGRRSHRVAGLLGASCAGSFRRRRGGGRPRRQSDPGRSSCGRLGA